MQLYFGFQPTNPVGDFFSKHGGFGVDIFFVISGLIMALVISNGEGDKYVFLKKRVIRIVPNYWLYTTVFLVMGLYVPNISSLDASSYTYFLSLFFIPHENPSDDLGINPTLPVGWTLNFEMFFYFSIFLILFIKWPVVKQLYFVALTMLSLPLLYHFCAVETYKVVAGNVRLWEFGGGCVIGIIYLGYKQHYLSILTGLLVLSFISIALDKLIYIPLAMLIVMSALAVDDLFKNNRLLTRLGVWLGEVSYSTYLAHGIILWNVHMIMDGVILIVQLLAYIICTIILSYVTYELIETRFSKYLTAKFVSNYTRPESLAR